MFNDPAVVSDQSGFIDLLATVGTQTLGVRADGLIGALVGAGIVTGTAYAVSIAVILRLAADKAAVCAAIAVGPTIRIRGVGGGMHSQRGPVLYPAADTSLLVTVLALAGKGVVNAVFISSRAVGVIKTQSAGLQMLLRAVLLRIAPLVLRAAGDRHG